VGTAVNITTKLLQLCRYRIAAINSLLPPEWEALTGYYLQCQESVFCSSWPRTHVLEWCSMFTFTRYISRYLFSQNPHWVIICAVCCILFVSWGDLSYIKVTV
jgi:hypothetical protein